MCSDQKIDSMNKSKEKTHRVFFALWPTDEVRKQIHHVYENSSYTSLAKGRRYKNHNLHLTLHFLGNITEEQLNCVKQQAKTLTASSFNLNINHFGRFKRAAILWLGAERLPDELKQLQQNLGELLTTCNYKPEAREYRPHITLMRKFNAELKEEGIESINWQVNQFALIESIPLESGVMYEPVEFYELNKH